MKIDYFYKPNKPSMQEIFDSKLQSKLPNLGTTIFTTMSVLANEHKAINLSQGFPDFPLDPQFEEILRRNLTKNVHQYAPMMGLLKLREAIQKLILNQHNRQLALDEILVTAGATQAIFTTIQALVNQDDEVIIIDPAYDCYAPAVQLVGGKCIHIPITADFKLDLARIQSALNPKTRMLIINNPHNPTGAVFGSDELKALVGLLKNFPNCLVLSDEVYEFINFSGETITMHQFESLHHRLISVSSFGKTLHVTGWKVGYLTASKPLISEIVKVHQYLVFSVNHYAQDAIADYINVVEIDEISRLYNKKRTLLQGQLEKSRFKLLPCSGTYFQLIDYSTISDEKDTDFAIRLTREIGVATIPVSVFFKETFSQNILRLCFAKSEETLTQAAQRLCQI
jgi:methionine transaminase